MTRDEWNRRKGRSSSVVRKSTRFAIFARDGFDCVWCRGVFPVRLDGAGLHLDHVIPRSAGGRSTPDNLVTACAECNTRRGSRNVPEFAASLAFFVACRTGGPSEPIARRTRQRVHRQRRKPLNRALGRWLAHMAKAAR